MENVEYLEVIDSMVFEEMFQQYVPIIYKMESRYLIRDFEHDDWLQEGRIALNNALKSYREDRGTTFGLYYKMILENQIRSLLRRQQAKKRFAQQQAVSIEKVGSETFSEYFHYHQQLEESLSISELLLKGEMTLSQLETSALYYYIRGEEPFEIATRLGETEKAIRNALNRTKNKIKKELAIEHP